MIIMESISDLDGSIPTVLYDILMYAPDLIGFVQLGT